MDGLSCRIINLQTGTIFEGDFKNGFCSQIGKILYPNGSIYFGQHKDFNRDGFGKLALLNGDIYEG